MGAAPFHIELGRDPQTGRPTFTLEGHADTDEITIKHGCLKDGSKATLIAVPNRLLDVRFDWDGLGLGTADAFGDHPQEPAAEPEPEPRTSPRIIELEPVPASEVSRKEDAAQDEAEEEKVPPPGEPVIPAPHVEAPKPPKNPTLRLPIAAIGLNGQVRNTLRKPPNKITTIEKLIALTPKELRRIHGVGPDSIYKIRVWLASKDLTLAGDTKPRDTGLYFAQKATSVVMPQVQLPESTPDAARIAHEAAEALAQVENKPVEVAAQIPAAPKKPGPKPRRPLTPEEQVKRDEANARQRRRRKKQLHPSFAPDIPQVVKTRTGLSTLYGMGLNPEDIDQFCALTAEDLLSEDFPGFNTTTVADIQYRLSTYGLKLGTPIPTNEEGN